jgi:hypothetical protein
MPINSQFYKNIYYFYYSFANFQKAEFFNIFNYKINFLTFIKFRFFKK